MKHLSNLIIEKNIDKLYEKLILSRNIKQNIQCEYFPKDEDELTKIINNKFDKQPDILDLTDIDVSKIKTFTNILKDIRWSVKKIDVSNWDLSSAKFFYGMFAHCYRLEEIIGLDTWDMSFTNKLKAFDTKYNVPLFECMFESCEKLNRLDLSSWYIDVDNCSFNKMFANCVNLETIGDVSNWKINFSTADKIDMSGMFENCKKLTCDISNWKYKPRKQNNAPNIKYK
jgi:hypothetical protein